MKKEQSCVVLEGLPVALLSLQVRESPSPAKGTSCSSWQSTQRPPTAQCAEKKTVEAQPYVGHTCHSPHPKAQRFSRRRQEKIVRPRTGESQETMFSTRTRETAQMNTCDRDSVHGPDRTQARPNTSTERGKVDMRSILLLAEDLLAVNC